MGDRAIGVLLAALTFATMGCERAPEAVAVVVALSGASDSLSGATLVADYSGAGATLQKTAGEPACAVLPPGLSAEFMDEGGGRLTIVVQAATVFSAPIEIAVCRMIPDVAGTDAGTLAARLRLSVAAATDAHGDPLDARRLAALTSGTRDDGSGSRAREAIAARDDSAETAAADRGGEENARLTEPLRQRSTGSAMRDAQRVSEREREGLEAREAAQAEDAGGSLDAPRDDLPQSLDEPEDVPIDGYGDEPAPQAADDLEEDEENDPDVRRRTPAYDCYMDVPNDVGLLTSLRFDVRHTGRTGGWEGNGPRVSCTWSVGAAKSACSDSGAGRLRCVVLDAIGFATPTPIVTCTFKSDVPPTVQNFNIEVIEALDSDSRQVGVDMTVTSVIPH